MKTESTFEKLCGLRNCCDEALSGIWDKSDEGFLAMQDVIGDVQETVVDLLTALEGLFKECRLVAKKGETPAELSVAERAVTFAKETIKKAKGELDVKEGAEQ